MGEPDDSICALILDMPSAYHHRMLQAAKELDLKEPRDLQDYSAEQIAIAASIIPNPNFREDLSKVCARYDVRLTPTQKSRNAGWGNS